MKRISIKNLEKQVSQASDFYGKVEITPEDFFRYKKFPFLAKNLVDVKCSNELFSTISDQILVQGKNSDNSSINFNLTEIETLDNIRRKRYKFLYFFSTLAVFVILFILFLYKSFYSQDDLSIGSVVGVSVAIFWFGLLAVGLIIEPIVRIVVNRSLLSNVVFQRATHFLRGMFVDYQQSLGYWQNLTWQDFEKEVTKRFIDFGYNAVNTKFSGDEGVDVVITNGHKKFIVQCKAVKNKIGPSIVRDFVGTMSIQKAQGGMIISLNGFSCGSLEATNYESLHLVSITDFLLMSKLDLRKIIGF